MPLAGANSDQARIGWVADALRSLPRGQRILDAGAGELRLKPYCAHLDYVSQDFCQYEGAGDGKALQTGVWDTTRIDIVSNIVSIPVPDASFDAVLCSEVLEHVPNPVAAIKEFSRVLKPGGTLLLTAPFCSLTHFAPYHFASGLNRYWYEEHLPTMGIKIEEITPNGNWFEFMGQELSRARFVSRTYSSPLLGWFMLAGLLPFARRTAPVEQTRPREQPIAVLWLHGQGPQSSVRFGARRGPSRGGRQRRCFSVADPGCMTKSMERCRCSWPPSCKKPQ